MAHEEPRKHPWTADVSAEEAERREKAMELEQLQERVALLQRELSAMTPPPGGFRGYYTAYYATTGFMLGVFGACTSLLFNIVGALLVGSLGGRPVHPLELIRVYLTFPLGERALELETGLALAVGCCLYVATGMLLGMVFHVMLTFYVGQSGFRRRFLIATVFSLVLWIVNFYGILSWLQPLLFHGDWIVRLIPWWVGAATHLVFGWTMALVYPWGLYVPYTVETESES